MHALNSSQKYVVVSEPNSRSRVWTLASERAAEALQKFLNNIREALTRFPREALLCMCGKILMVRRGITTEKVKCFLYLCSVA